MDPRAGALPANSSAARRLESARARKMEPGRVSIGACRTIGPWGAVAESAISSSSAGAALCSPCIGSGAR
jgi:hypothetical protein